MPFRYAFSYVWPRVSEDDPISNVTFPRVWALRKRQMLHSDRTFPRVWGALLRETLHQDLTFLMEPPRSDESALALVRI